MSFIHQTTKYSLSIQKLVLKSGQNTFDVQVFRLAEKAQRIKFEESTRT